MIPAMSGVDMALGAERRGVVRQGSGGDSAAFEAVLGSAARTEAAPKVRDRPVEDARPRVDGASEETDETGSDSPPEEADDGGEVVSTVPADGAIDEAPPPETVPKDGRLAHQGVPPEGEAKGARRADRPVTVPSQGADGRAGRSEVQARDAGAQPAPVGEGSGAQGEVQEGDDALEGGVAQGGRGAKRRPDVDQDRAKWGGSVEGSARVRQHPRVGEIGVMGEVRTQDVEAESVVVARPSGGAEPNPKPVQGAGRGDAGTVQGLQQSHQGSGASDGWAGGMGRQDDRGWTGAPKAEAVQADRGARAEQVARFEGPVIGGGEGSEVRGAAPGGMDAGLSLKIGGAQKGAAVGAGMAGRVVQDGPGMGFEGAVTRGFSAVLRQNGGSVVIRLIPETLGPLRISMTMDRSSVSVMLDAATPQAHELLTSNLGSLRQSLESQGLRVDRIGVTVTQSVPQLASAPGADGAAHQRGSEDPGGGRQDAADGRSRGHADQSSRDRRGGAHADPTPPFGSFSELIESAGTPMRFVATA